MLHIYATSPRRAGAVSQLLSNAVQPPPPAGATGGAAAASTLLTEVLPAALGSPLDDFIAAMASSGDAAVEADAAELR